MPKINIMRPRLLISSYATSSFPWEVVAVHMWRLGDPWDMVRMPCHGLPLNTHLELPELSGHL